MRKLIFSKITQPTLKNLPSNYSPYDAKSVICGSSEKSLLLESYGLSNKCLLFLFSWERGFSMGSSVTECT